MNDAIIDITALALLVLAAAWSVLSTRLVRAVVGLAAASVLLSVLVFRLDSPLAAVFELSVCAGLISATFLGAITLTRAETDQDIVRRAKVRTRRYWYLPPLLLLVGVAIAQQSLPNMPDAPVISEDVRQVLWTSRHLDLLGQVVILVAGAFGVTILFKEAKKHER
jgi:NADH-quinone oxidoreductase subunit J